MLTSVEIFGAGAEPLVLPIGLGSDVANNPIQIKELEGLGPVAATLSTTQMGDQDAELLLDASVGKRNIVMTVRPNPDWVDQTTESIRQILYAYMMPKRSIRMRFHSTHLPTCEIVGVVESMDPGLFSQDPEIPISIICPNPDFVAIEETTISFPVTVQVSGDALDKYDHIYTGSVPTGVILEVRSTPENPTYFGFLELHIRPLDEPSETDYFVVIFPETEEITPLYLFRMSSVPGNKIVHRVVVATDDVEANLLRRMTAYGVHWPRLLPGENQLSVSADDPDQEATIRYFNRYGGL